MKALLACLAFLAILPADVQAKPKDTVAVLGLEVADDGSGIDEKSVKFAKELTEALRQRAKVGTGPFVLVANGDKDLLEVKVFSGCDTEADDCMADIGRGLPVTRLIYGRVQKRKDGYQVSLKLLNVPAKKVERNAPDLIPFNQSSGAELTRWSRTLYGRLTGASEQGALIVKANVDQGTLYVDGAVKGNLVGGTARVDGLAEGKYQVAIEAPGHLRYEAKIEVSGGADTTHSAELEANALRDPTGGATGETSRIGTISTTSRPGGGHRALFWTSLVITAGSATAMTITGLQVRGSLQDDKEAKILAYQQMHPAVGGAPAPLSGDDACADAENLGPDAQPVVDACDAGRRRALLTNVLIGTTVAAAAATAFFYYKGYVSSRSPESSTVGRRRAKQRPTFSVIPAVSPDQVGAGLQIDF